MASTESSGSFGVTLEGMQGVAGTFEATIDYLNGRLANVNQQWATLQGGWTGRSSNHFGAALDAWEGEFRRVIDALIDMLEFLGVNTETYRQQEDDATSIADSFAKALDGV